MKLSGLLLFAVLPFWSFAQQGQTPDTNAVSDLLDQLWENPVLFENQGKMELLIDDFEAISAVDLNRVLKKIFEQNNGLIENRSQAHEGMLGKLNLRSDWKRRKQFDKQMKRSFRDPDLYPDNKLIIAEGDSWFQFPFLLKDIVDQLKKREDYALFSLAYGGEWLSNIIEENNYQDSYLQLRPDVFLMSGGGNDLVHERLTSMVDLPKNNPLSKTYLDGYRDFLITRLTDLPNSPPFNDQCLMPSAIRAQLEERRDSLRYDQDLVDLLMHGRTFLNNRFYVLLTLHKLQYYLFLENLKKADPKYFENELTIVIQGYDYPIPSFKKGNHLGQILLNLINHNGQWLKLPLMSKGITNAYDQRAVMATILFEFNEMMIDIVTDKRYSDAALYLIDCRGAIAQLSQIKPQKYYWNDEMHPSSAVFKEIAQAYQNCIDGKQDEKVVRLLSLMQKNGH